MHLFILFLAATVVSCTTGLDLRSRSPLRSSSQQRSPQLASDHPAVTGAGDVSDIDLEAGQNGIDDDGDRGLRAYEKSFHNVKMHRRGSGSRSRHMSGDAKR